jgi:hypothetical protein
LWTVSGSGKGICHLIWKKGDMTKWTLQGWTRFCWPGVTIRDVFHPLED